VDFPDEGRIHLQSPYMQIRTCRYYTGPRNFSGRDILHIKALHTFAAVLFLNGFSCVSLYADARGRLVDETGTKVVLEVYKSVQFNACKKIAPCSGFVVQLVRTVALLLTTFKRVARSVCSSRASCFVL